ncbi:MULTISPECIES: helix-turn-helix transcriptional regulator [unclassified Mesorhizobium]|uniref:helix-turn-helix transcriptional regulator n=1 Tax=unclassified Mesorhizobium TaxID=325217 RepID=UPI0007018ABC|nr:MULTISPECIES: helix-turn-helix transcriptional regulator [unclassified Mesorhizobium]KQZ15246.1 hypothetical protein ASD27_15170 [Mesorhizobium sp. Root1471]KQZ37755.1 hypothetical protein ASD44_15165 [Mesorhizobium sp. Root554]MDR7033602.1 DNA-binding CsgD family transcriptional regulator [Mesorhizobium sp. BE184]
MPVPLIDRIYEAAFVPEFWPSVLDDMAAMSGSVSGAVLVFSGIDQPPLYRTTDYTRASLHEFTTTERWRESRRAEALFKNIITGDFSSFQYLNDHMSAEQLAGDSVARSLRELGLEAQATTVIPLFSGEVVSFTFERRAGEGRHSAEALAMLDKTRPHLARSGLMAAKLRLERAEATVSALQAIGLPAAVLQKSGKVLATNILFDAAASLFLPRAFGRVALADAAAETLFRNAVEASAPHDRPVVRSIPVAASETTQACVVHILPLCRSAHDIFSSGDMLIAATAVGAHLQVPQASILTGLFDFSPAEVKLAIGLASGASVNDAAVQNGITVKTARTYLERLFAKTGTHRQSDLVALLKTASPLGF